MIEEGLFTFLTVDSAAVTALISTRCYKPVLPQGATKPALVYRRVSDVPYRSHDGPAAVDKARFQITAHDTDPDDATTLANTVITAMDGERGTWGSTVVSCCICGNSYDLGYVEATESYQVAVDVTLIYEV